MTSILILREAIYCNFFRCLYLRKEKYFLNFPLHFLNLDSILNISKKGDCPNSCIFKLYDLEKRG